MCGRLLGLRLADHAHDLGQGGVAGLAGGLDLDGAGAVDRPGENGGCGEDGGGAGPGLGEIIDRLLVDRHALPSDGGLIDAGGPLDDEAVGGQAFIGPDHHHLADFKRLDRYLDHLAVTPHPGGARGEFRQGLDGALGPAHGVVLQGVAEAEEKEEQGAFRPGAERRRPRRRHQHQGVDLEALAPEVVDRFAHGEEAAQAVSAEEERERDPARQARRQFFQGEAEAQGAAGGKGEDQFGVGAENPSVGVIMVGVILLPGIVVVAGVVVCGVFSPGREGLGGEGQAVAGERLDQLVAGDPVLVELDADRAGGVEADLKEAGLRLEVGLERTGVPRMAHALGPADQVAEATADLDPGLERLAAHLVRRQEFGVVVQAELGPGRGFRDVDLGQAGRAGQAFDEALDAGVQGVGRFGEKDRYVESDGARHA